MERKKPFLKYLKALETQEPCMRALATWGEEGMSD